MVADPEVLALQIWLNQNGYGPLKPDGIDGECTKRAYAQALRDSPVGGVGVAIPSPEPMAPWWRTRRAHGALLMVAGLAGLFVPALRDVDMQQVAELIWSNLDHVEHIVSAVSALVAAGGAIVGVIGAARARSPIDPTLVARVGGRDVRLPRLLRPAGAPGAGDVSPDAGGLTERVAPAPGPLDEH